MSISGNVSGHFGCDRQKRERTEFEGAAREDRTASTGNRFFKWCARQSGIAERKMLIDHFVLQPTIRFHNHDHDYAFNKLGEGEQPAQQGFEYNSGKNSYFLSVEEILQYNKRALE